MSYCRWSTILDGSDIPIEEYINTKSFKALAEKYNKEISDWYIFWYSAGKECDSDKRDEQLLALWHKGSRKYPVLDYPSVKAMYDADNWEELEVITQKEFMRECVKDWLDEVEEDYENDK